MDETLTITLKKPIKTKAGDEITSITVREPTAGEWRTWDQLRGVEADIAAVSKVSGQHPFVIEQMAASQLSEAAAFLGSFLNSAPSLGEA